MQLDASQNALFGLTEARTEAFAIFRYQVLKKYKRSLSGLKIDFMNII